MTDRPSGDAHTTGDAHHDATAPAPTGSQGTEVEVHDQQHPEFFENPGLPPHSPRRADVDDKAAKRAEMQVTALFLMSILGTLIFIVSYFVIPMNKLIYIPLTGEMSALHLGLGLGLALSLLGIGLGAVHWAKTLMPDEEVVEMRKPQRSDDEDRHKASKILSDGAEAAQLNRRPMLKFTLGGALGLFAVPLGLQVAAGLGPLPGKKMYVTMWDKAAEMADGPDGGLPLVIDPSGRRIKAEQVTMDSIFHALPEGYDQLDQPLNEKAKSSIILVRLHPDKIKSQKQRDWGHDGIVAYSKICTHVGCPVALYEKNTHHLLCPCHQSTFDMTDDCKVIFGPAKRALPQLPITVNSEGYIVATRGFEEPIGPSFWERG